MNEKPILMGTLLDESCGYILGSLAEDTYQGFEIRGEALAKELQIPNPKNDIVKFS